MEFEFTEEQLMIQSYGSKLAQSFDHAEWLKYAERREFPRHVWEQMGADGFLGMMVPEAYGGAGLGMTEMALSVWLQSSHPTMPNIVLSQDEIRNVVAYIRSLKGKG